MVIKSEKIDSSNDDYFLRTIYISDKLAFDFKKDIDNISNFINQVQTMQFKPWKELKNDIYLYTGNIGKICHHQNPFKDVYFIYFIKNTSLEVSNFFAIFYSINDLTFFLKNCFMEINDHNNIIKFSSGDKFLHFNFFGEFYGSEFKKFDGIFHKNFIAEISKTAKYDSRYISFALIIIFFVFCCFILWIF